MKKRILTKLLCASLIFSNLIGGVAASSDNQSIDVKAEMPKIQASVESGGSLDTTRHVTFSCTEIEPDCKVFVTTDGSQPEPNGATSIDGRSGVSLDQFRHVRASAYHGDEKICENEFIYSVENNYTSKDEWLYDKSEESLVYPESDMQSGWFSKEYADNPNIPRRTGSTYFEYVEPEFYLEDIDLYYLGDILLNEIENPALVFSVYHEKETPEDLDSATVFVEVAPFGNFTFLKMSASIKAAQPVEGWQEYYIDLSAYKGEQIWVRLCARGSGRVIVDDMKLANMDLSVPSVATSQQEPYDDTKITLNDASGNLIYYKEDLEPTMDGNSDTLLNENKSFAPTPFSDPKKLYFYSEKEGAKSAVSFYELPVVKTKPVIAEFSGQKTDYRYGDEVTLKTDQKLANGEMAPIYYSFEGKPVILEDGTPAMGTWLYTTPFTIHPPVTTLQAVAHVADMEETVSIYPIEFPQLKDVNASVPSGSSVLQGTKIHLSGETGATIRYTTDGTTPTDKNGEVYKEPITIDKDTLIITNSFKQGYMDGKTRSYSYSINAKGDVYEPNNTPNYGTALGFPFRLEGTLQPQGDQDYYSFEFPSTGRVEVRLESSIQSKNYTLKLLDEMGKVVAKTSSKGVLSISCIIETGKYRVLVEGDASVEKYTLNVSRQAVQGMDLSENNLLTTLGHSQSPVSWDYGLNGGGNFCMSSAYFSSWRGPVEEIEDVYDSSNQVLIPDTDNVDESKIPYKPLSGKYHLQNALFLPSPMEDDGAKSLKAAIYTYGAVDLAYMNNPQGWDENLTYHYLPRNIEDANSYGHAVTAVGWDDTIPKEKFSVTINGQTYMPSSNGAFIIKNSWGTDVGEEGYAYISYESTYLDRSLPVIYILDELPGNYNTVYEYDKLGPVSMIGLNENSCYTKNVFTSNGNESLRAVSFYATDTEQIYDIYIKVGDGEIEHVARGSRTYAGYITQRLDKEIHLPANTKFEVIVRCENPTGKPIGTFVETAVDGYTGKASASSGQSYYSKDGMEWEDISSKNINACIKAFTYDKEQTKTRTASMEEDTIHTSYTREEWNAMENTVPIEYVEGTTDMKSPIAAYSVDTEEETLPARFDLRDIGAVTSVKNQGYIGSCWTFAAMGSAESVFMRNNNTAYTYPKNIALSKSHEDVSLTEGKPQVEVSASASIFPEEIANDKVLWSYSGDLDSIDIQNTTSRSGEDTILFTAKASGTITVTAQSATDVNHQATMTVEILDETIKPDPEEKPKPKPDLKPDPEEKPEPKPDLKPDPYPEQRPEPKPENTNKEQIEPSNKKESTTPKTGDDNSTILWMLLLLVVAQGIVWGKKKFYR